MMARYCEFILKEEGKTCTSCNGWFCTSTGRKKKLADVDYCRDYRDECSRYLKVYPRPIEEREFISTDDDIESVTLPGKTAKPKKTVKTQVATPLIVKSLSTNCSYMGSVPSGCSGCGDYWCYAKDEPLRVVKRCKSPPSWRECRRRYDAIRKGVKHAST